MGLYGTVAKFSGLIADINAAYCGTLQNWKTKGRPKTLSAPAGHVTFSDRPPVEDAAVRCLVKLRSTVYEVNLFHRGPDQEN